MRDDQGESQAYRRDIDGLRALAVAAIVIHHAFPAILPGGFVGVDVFFVISGFLITRILIEARDGGRFSWGEFYLRRARRIVPAYVAVTLITAALAVWIEMPRLLAQTGAATAASGLFLANVLAAQSPGYFAPSMQQNPLLHLWSLGVEEQFYLVWPVLIALLSLGWVRRTRTGLALALLAASLVLAQQRQLGGRPDVCARVDPGPPLARAMPAEAAIRAAVEDRPGVAAVFPTETLCLDGGCAGMIDGRPVYFDDDHLSASGARRLVPAWMDDGWRRAPAPLGSPRGAP